MCNLIPTIGQNMIVPTRSILATKRFCDAQGGCDRSSWGVWVIDMRLLFEGQATTEATGDVRFAGQHDDAGQRRVVICRVNKEALIARCKLANPTPAELLAAYRSVSSEVNMLAAAQYAGGIMKPIVALSDLAKTTVADLSPLGNAPGRHQPNAMSISWLCIGNEARRRAAIRVDRSVAHCPKRSSQSAWHINLLDN
jgi:hypothetical protein